MWMQLFGSEAFSSESLVHDQASSMIDAHSVDAERVLPAGMTDMTDLRNRLGRRYHHQNCMIHAMRQLIDTTTAKLKPRPRGPRVDSVDQHACKFKIMNNAP